MEQTVPLLPKFSLPLSKLLAKLKTREKKFKFVADHVNSLHHHRNPFVFPFTEAKVKREEKRRERKFRRERGGGVREGAREAEKGSCWIVEKLRGRFIRITKETST
ncbi:hypothetical protein HN51_018027 [Arachis hypogaea]